MPVLTPLGNDTILRDKIPGIAVETADWGETSDLAGLPVTLSRCHHWSARWTSDRSMALWAAFTLDTPAGRIFHIGDTGYDQGRPYEGLPDDIRLAILPIGAYAPRWFMKPQHQDPGEAVAGFEALGARYAIGHHWGTFQLTDEAREEPPEKLAEALAARDIAPTRFRPLSAGEVWDIPT
jgi:L-ascorbate metabolism protein UlaG (beta-lactamase superfamily)